MGKRATILRVIGLVSFGIGVIALILRYIFAQWLLLIVGGISLCASSILLNVSLAMFLKIEQNEKQS